MKKESNEAMELGNALFFESQEAWRKWLQKNHSRKKGVWLVHYKKHTGKKGVTHPEALEEALCFGWIDSVLKKLDEERFALKYSPRKPKSVWSKKNKETAERLIETGKMEKPGLDAIETAKKNGSWQQTYTNLKKEKMPSDLKKELLKDKTAWKNFLGFANTYRNMFIGWINSAKTIETRKKRTAVVAKCSRENKKYFWANQ